MVQIFLELMDCQEILENEMIEMAVYEMIGMVAYEEMIGMVVYKMIGMIVHEMIVMATYYGHYSFFSFWSKPFSMTCLLIQIHTKT